MNMYQPMYGVDAMAAEQMALQQRIQQMEQQRQQFQYPTQQMQAPPAQNVNWIHVAGIDGAKNQIVQPGQTTWMMDNNSPFFYVKSVDNMGSATLRVFQFQEIPPDTLTAPQTQQKDYSDKYVTREEYNELLKRLGENTQEKEGKA
nr:MAG TPA: hypothetical protein [Caudoviricetes sp.]